MVYLSGLYDMLQLLERMIAPQITGQMME